MILDFLDISEQYPVVFIVLTALGSLVVMGQAWVAFTPTKDDDKFLQKIEKYPVVGHLLKFLAKFAIIGRKEKK